jgi:outer membrane biogenesis lipoprotein LolB
MKTTILLSLSALFLFAGCTVKQVQTQPSGPSYEQQQKSFQKATEGM